MSDDNRNSGGQLSSLITGIVIGVAAAMWANDDSRAKIKQKFSDFTDMGKDKVQQGKKKLAAGLGEAKRKLDEDDGEELQ